MENQYTNHHYIPDLEKQINFSKALEQMYKIQKYWLKKTVLKPGKKNKKGKNTNIHHIYL